MYFRFLLPHRFRFVGAFLFISGLVAVYLRFWLGIKPASLTLPVFSVYSTFLETKTFHIITNNISEEITALFLIIGLLLLNFSKESSETDLTNHFRFNALFYSMLANSIFLIIATLFIYGFAFVNILMLNMFSQLMFYQIIFRILIYRNKTKLNTDGIS